MEFLKAAAQVAQVQVKELKLGALELAEDLTGVTPSIVKKGGGVRKELEFQDGPLGFRLEGLTVCAVDPESQAKELGVEVGDDLTGVDGYAIPSGDGPDEEAFPAFVAQKWLKDLPRPGSLTFMSGQPASPVEEEMHGKVPFEDVSPASPTTVLPGEVSDAGPASRQAIASEVSPTKEKRVENVRALMQMAEEWTKQQNSVVEGAGSVEVEVLQAELKREQEEKKQLSLELQKSKHSNAQTKASTEQLKGYYEKIVNEQQEQLTLARQIIDNNTPGPEHLQVIELYEAKQNVLIEQLTMMKEAFRKATEYASKSALEDADKISDARTRASAAESRAATLTLRCDDMAKELRSFNEVHESELEILRGNHDTQLKAAQEEYLRNLKQMEENVTSYAESTEAKAAAQAEAHAKEAEELRHRALEAEGRALEAEGLARAAQAAAAAARSEGVNASSDADNGEVLTLHGRIITLEEKCTELQKELNARPMIFQNPPGSDMDDLEFAHGVLRRPQWEVSLISVIGPQAGALVAVGFDMVDTAMRNFTRRLLKQDAWMWLFYVHLVVLYLIAASAWAETGPLLDGSTADIQLTQGAPVSLRGSVMAGNA